MIRAFVILCLLVGTIARALPLFDLDGRALRQFASEDGYLMLTISRNLAIGNGMSVEDGTAVTNGTQPLMTFVYAALFWVVGGDKSWGVVLAQALGIVIALTCAWLLYRVGTRLLRETPNGGSVAVVAAAVWYVSPIGARYTQNCLETGAAALVPLVICLYFLRHAPGRDSPWSISYCMGLGALLGLGFWVRNDSVLLSASVCGVTVLSGLSSNSISPFRRVAEAAAIGFTALLVVSPWLAFNYSLFESIVPISGISQGEKGVFGGNLVEVPGILLEQISVVAMVPQQWQTTPVVLFIGSLLAATWLGVAVWAARGLDPIPREWLLIALVWSGLLVFFYGAIYGAGYFMGRYLFVLSPWMALLTTLMALRLWQAFGEPAPRAAAAVAFGLVLAIAVALDVRAYRKGLNNGHFQVVDWVDANVPDDTWIGAIQTGTLGFFHDRTYNLDGKVSPAALAARQDGRIFEYLLERPTQYLVDWVGITGWLEDERLSSHFELVVRDEERNLAVLKRKTR
jgi:hypothetical protein